MTLHCNRGSSSTQWGLLSSGVYFVDGKHEVIFEKIVLVLLVLYAIGTFPTILRSSVNPAEHSLTIYNSDSSELTLKYLLTIVAIGVPLWSAASCRTGRARPVVGRGRPGGVKPP